MAGLGRPIVQWVNLHYTMYDKSGALVLGPASGNTLWAGSGTPCATHNDGDPIVLYDRAADRWIMSQFTSSSPYGQCVAVSTTGDPTGSYYRYFFQFSTTVFYDYPHLGVWPDGYYMGANRFSCTVFLGICIGFQYQGPSAIVFDRAKMLAGQPASFQEFKLASSFGTLLPADVDSATFPPTGSAGIFAEIGSTALHMWRLKVNWTQSSSSSFTGPTTLPVATYNALCSGIRSCVPQPGTTVGLDGLGDRLMYRLAYRNFGDHESLVVNHAVNAASSGMQAGIRWYEIRLANGSPTIYQQGTFAPNDGVHRWMGSMAMDRDGNIAVGYSVSNGADVYPGINYAVHLAADPPGQLTQETSLVKGAGSQIGTDSRWGDYAAMSVDPIDDCTFWFTTEYMATTGFASWQTRIASFKVPTCGSVVSPPDSTPTLTPTITPTVTTTPTPTVTTTPGDTPTITVSTTPTNTPPTVPSNTPAITPTITTTMTPTLTSTPGTVDTPSAPQSLTAAPANGKGVSLTWSAPASNGGAPLTGYNVYRGTSPGAESTKVAALGTVLTYKDSSTRRGTHYYYVVKAVNSQGESPASNEASATAK
jgi:hypothetical protein